MYKLQRGTRAEIEGAILTQIGTLLKDGKKDMKEKIDALILSKDVIDGSFAGVLFSVRFKASKAVALTGVGFWGPSCSEKIERKSYDVRIEIGLNVTTTTVQAEPKAIFDVTLKEKVELKADEWIQIQFQLDGPKTGICGKVQTSYNCKDSGVVFEFDFPNSSRQLPVIYYNLGANETCAVHSLHSVLQRTSKISN